MNPSSTASDAITALDLTIASNANRNPHFSENGDTKMERLDSAESTAAFQRAALADEKRNDGILPAGFSSHVGVRMARALPFEKSQMIRAQRPVVAMALSENPPSDKFANALSASLALHIKGKAIGDQIKGILHGLVGTQYLKSIHSISERILRGDLKALTEVEHEKTIESRFEVERAALHAAMWKLGHAQVKHSLVLRDEIARSLGKLAKGLENRDAADCKKFGIELDYSMVTRLTQAVIIQFERRTFGLEEMALLKRTDPCSLSGKDLFGDFLDLSIWN